MESYLDGIKSLHTGEVVRLGADDYYPVSLRSMLPRKRRRRKSNLAGSCLMLLALVEILRYSGTGAFSPISPSQFSLARITKASRICQQEGLICHAQPPATSIGKLQHHKKLDEKEGTSIGDKPHHDGEGLNDERTERERIKRERIARRISRRSLPPAAAASSSKALPSSSATSRFLPAISRDDRIASSSALARGGGSRGGEGNGRHTVDLYVPRTDLDVMMAWADRLEEVRQPNIILADKEQRMLALAQMFLGLEKVRVDLSSGKPIGSITPRQLATKLGLTTDEVEAFYRLGLRARSYILMSMNSIILALANKYSATFGVDQAELVQEGYKGVLMAIERYDHVKAATSGATFRGFAYVYVMSAMIAAAKRELNINSSPAPRDPSMMRLPSGDGMEGEEGGGGRGSLSGLLSIRASVRRLGPGASREEEDEEEEDEEEMEWEKNDEEAEDGEEAREVALEEAEERRMATKRRKRRAPRIRRITRMLPGHEAAVEGRRGRSELFGIDPEVNRPAYEILDERKRAQDVSLFLSRAEKEMSPLDMEVLSLVYGLKGGIPMKRAQVARKLGLHASAVSKSEKRALRKLREMLEISSSSAS